MVAPLAAAAATAVLGILASMLQGHHKFVPGACERLEPFLLDHIVGQDLAIRQFADATCDLLRREHGAGPGKPLIMSAHGPPGVGKSLTHWLAARALYNADPLADARCPGHACTGYKVLYGMDYVSAERDEQHAYLRAALLDHLKQAGNSLLVIEEYDKLDCPTRAMFRQLFENLHAANVTGARPIILLESNTGYPQLHQMLEDAGDRAKVVAEEAQRALKDLIFQTWAAAGCESRADTLKMVGMIDFFLPYLPLDHAHIRRLFDMRLREEAESLRQHHRCRLYWGPIELDFLVSKVDFEGPYAIEGAKEVSTVMTRHVSRLLRLWLARQSQGDALQVGRRQATDRFKQYLRKAVTSGSHLFARTMGDSQQSAGSNRMEEGGEEFDVTLQLRVAADRLTLEQQPGG